ncbi:unnamed protein product [Lasius platythorax]|uniref:Uncharacterized protein n=1 Tax=Lasius platythorax TaxID=488582 RepID=A0AAV2NNW0_9HYME
MQKRCMREAHLSLNNFLEGPEGFIFPFGASCSCNSPLRATCMEKEPTCEAAVTSGNPILNEALKRNGGVTRGRAKGLKSREIVKGSNDRRRVTWPL